MVATNQTTKTTSAVEAAATATTTKATAATQRLKRKALIVGIDAYPAPNSLNGCVADAKDMWQTLLINGFPRTRVKTLFNQKATKKNIMDGLAWLVQDANPNDVLVFYYSGHGTQIPEPSDDTGDEVTDHIDEAICPVDLDFDKGTYIVDDELKAVFDKLPDGVRLDVVFDSCFSGSATRSSPLGLVAAIAQARARKQRYLRPPLELQMIINGMVPSQTERRRFGKASIAGVGAGDRVEVQKGQKNALWAACLENQVSWELELEDGQIRGAYTAVFCKILRASNGNISRIHAYQLTRTRMDELGYEQIPALEVPVESSLSQYPFRKPNEDDPSEKPEKLS